MRFPSKFGSAAGKCWIRLAPELPTFIAVNTSRSQNLMESGTLSVGITVVSRRFGWTTMQSFSSFGNRRYEPLILAMCRLKETSDADYNAVLSAGI